MAVTLVLTSKVREDGDVEVTLANHGETELAAGFKLAFSTLAPTAIREGGKQVNQVGGYCEVHPEPNSALTAGKSWQFVIGYFAGRHKPLNESWCIEGAYVIDTDNQALHVTSHPPDFGNVPLPEPQPLSSPQPELLLLPSPTNWEPSGGQLPISVSLQLQASSELTQTVQEITDFASRIGQPLAHGLNPIPVALSLTNEDDKPSYQLSFATDKITLTASNTDGLRYGLISLLQLRATHPNGIPTGKITDVPRFSWRGMHFDTARHFYSVATIKRVLDFLALLKLNKFHWHLIEDEAFRLELPSFRELIEKTAYRGHGHLIPSVFAAGICQGGYYSQAEVKEVIRHANSLGITVMPEIELPGHALALNKVYPELLDPDDTGTVASVQGYLQNCINPAMPATWQFLEKVLPEIAATFGPGLLHVGGDETPKDVWANSPAVQKLMHQEKLTDHEDVFEWTCKRIGDIVTSIGNQRPAAWVDAAFGKNGGMGNNTLMFAWENYESGVKAAEAGYDVVMAPAQRTYMDMAPDEHPSRRGMNWAAIIGLADTINWEPVPRPELEDKIIGVHGAYWSETTITDSYVEPMLAPRMLGVAETAWAQPHNKVTSNALRHHVTAWQPLLGGMAWQMGPCT